MKQPSGCITTHNHGTVNWRQDLRITFNELKSLAASYSLILRGVGIIQSVRIRHLCGFLSLDIRKEGAPAGITIVSGLTLESAFDYLHGMIKGANLALNKTKW